MKSNKSSFTYRGVKYNQNDISSSDSRLSHGTYRELNSTRAHQKKVILIKRGLYRGVNYLSKKRILFKWAFNLKPIFLSGWQDSNLRPPRPKRGAITGLRYTPWKRCKYKLK